MKHTKTKLPAFKTRTLLTFEHPAATKRSTPPTNTDTTLTDTTTTTFPTTTIGFENLRYKMG